MTHINDNSRPLIFLGSNSNMLMLKEVCEDHNIEMFGIIDSDYAGQESFQGFPVLGGFDMLEQNLDTLKERYNFYCATNWIPTVGQERNTNKRTNIINLIEQHQLPTISLVQPLATVSRYASVGKNVFIGAHTFIEPESVLEDFSSVYQRVGVGHGSRLGKNSVLQRQVGMTSNVTIEENVYVSHWAKLGKPYSTLKRGTWVQNCVYLMRNTTENEVIAFDGYNTKRVYSLFPEVQE